MLGIIVSFLIACLVLYKLFTTLGYYDESQKGERKNKLKDILAKVLNSDEKEEVITPTENLDVQYNEEIESSILSSLNEESKNNLKSINEIADQSKFSLSGFSKHVDCLYTKFFKLMHEKNTHNLKDLVSEGLFFKLDGLIHKYYQNFNLVRINCHEKGNDKIEIKNIKRDGEIIIIALEIESEKMIKEDGDHYKNITSISKLTYFCPLSEITKGNWILSEFHDKEIMR